MIDISSFRGEIPRLSDRLLPDNHASNAINCNLENGILKPINGVSSIQGLEASTISIYKMRNNFLQWPTDINVVKSFLHGTSDSRIIFTGDEYPKETNESLAIVSSPYPSGTRRLGIPAPTNALTITPEGTQGSDIVRTASYVYTLVGKWEDGSEVESAPSPATAVVDVYEGITLNLSGYTNSTVDGVYTTHFRTYRATSGNVGTEYHYIHEMPVSSVTFEDTISDDDVQEPIPTSEWTSPIEALSGLTATSHGLLFGFSENVIYPSDVFITYAFPFTYNITVESNIVGLGYTGSLVVVLTETVPYILEGQNPEMLTVKRLGYQQPCVSKKSIVNIPGGVVYASFDGLFLINESGAGALITRDLFTKEQWKDFPAETLLGFFYDNQYIGFFTGTTDGFSLHLETKDYRKFSIPGVLYGGDYSAIDDLLYLIYDGETDREVISWDTGDLLDYTWESKEFSTSYRKVYNAGIIQGDFTDASVEIVFYADGIEVDRKTINESKVFRIKGMIGAVFKIKMQGFAEINRVIIGESISRIMEGMGNV